MLQPPSFEPPHWGRLGSSSLGSTGPTVGLGQLLAMGWLFTAIWASSAQQNHLLWAFRAPTQAPTSTAGFMFLVLRGCSGTAEQEPSQPRVNKSPFAPEPELSLAVGGTARGPQNIPQPRCSTHSPSRGSSPALLRTGPRWLCSAVPALGKIRRPAPVFFPVGSRSWDAGEAGGCSALLSSCLWAVPACGGRSRRPIHVGLRGPPALLHPPSSSF